MRVEISYKFVVGFIFVVASVVLLNLLVPKMEIPEWTHQWITVFGALLVGLIFGWLFSKAFTANIKILTEGAERLSEGDLSRKVRLRKGMFSDETEDLAGSLNLVVDSLRNLVAVKWARIIFLCLPSLTQTSDSHLNLSITFLLRT